jgi:purine-cytosine permease-like protein
MAYAGDNHLPLHRSAKSTMTWLKFISSAEWVVQICANVVILCALYPLYKRTKNIAFLLLGYGYLIGTFNTICDQTIGLEHMTSAVYVGYRILRRLAYIADCLLCTAGLLLLLRTFQQAAKPDSEGPASTGCDPEKPPGFFTRITRKMEE